MHGTRYFIAALLFVAWPVFGRAQNVPPDSIQLRKGHRVAAIQTGIASFYSDKFEGRRMANGQIFTQKKMTAASNTLPLNCWVRVTNLSNHKVVVVKITDRMHPKNKRLIDLSRLAATRLNYIGKGLTKVRVEYLGRQKPAENEPDRGQ